MINEKELVKLYGKKKTKAVLMELYDILKSIPNNEWNAENIRKKLNEEMIGKKMDKKIADEVSEEMVNTIFKK